MKTYFILIDNIEIFVKQKIQKMSSLIIAMSKYFFATFTTRIASLAFHYGKFFKILQLWWTTVAVPFWNIFTNFVMPKVLKKRVLSLAYVL